MCDCQPDIVMFAEFQPPLFQRYDLSVEFLRRRRQARDLMDAQWVDLRSMPDEEITTSIAQSCAIEPLRLVTGHARLIVEPTPYTARDGRTCHFYRKFIPFAGDAELWELSPSPFACGEAEGAIAYLEYVTSTLEVNEQCALRQLDQQVARAERLIALQLLRIEPFNGSLQSMVRREVARRRRVEVLPWWERAVGSA